MIKKPRIPDLRKEQSLWKNGLCCVGGCDEVGIGAVAGPIVAAIAVVGDVFRHIEGIKDSKRLSKKMIKALALRIKKNCMAYGVGMVDNEIIDERGVRAAIELAVTDAYEEALYGLGGPLDYLLIDGKFTYDCLEVRQEAVIKGDNSHVSVAAASIIAKDARDSFMIEVVHEEHPEYNFAKNVGYYTSFHKDMVRKHGLCKYHRKSYKFKR